MATVNEKMTALADEIRKYGSLDGSMSIDRMTESISLVHEKAYGDGEMSGFARGEDEGYQYGYKAGQTDEYNRFCDVYQNNGGEQNYYYAFAYDRFTDENYDPPYDIKCVNGILAGTFLFFKAHYIRDTKVAIYANETSANSCFDNAYRLKTIRLFSVHETTVLASTFASCNALQNLSMAGIIGQNINLQWSPLTRASIESVIEHLSDTAEGKTASFKLSAVEAAFETSEGINDGSGSEEWLALVATKPNWTVNLI